MNTTDTTITALDAWTPGTARPHRVRAFGAALLAAVAVSIGVVRLVDDGSARPPAAHASSRDDDAIMRDLVDRGLIPRQSLEPASDPHDAIVRELVQRGLIPRQALER